MKHLSLFIILIAIFSIQADAQLFKKKARDCESCPRHFKYLEYWDPDSSIVNTKGHYCYGLPCKTWRYYHKNGNVRMKVKYRDRIKIKYYRDNGQLEKKGCAMLDVNKEALHFYWHGRWKYFDAQRHVYRVALYENGIEIQLIMGPEYPLYFE